MPLTDILDVDLLAMNQWDFGFSTVGARISTFCVGTKAKQSFDQKGRWCQHCWCWPTFSPFLLSYVPGIAFILLSTDEDPVTASDQRNVSRSNNCHFLAEAGQSPCETVYLVFFAVTQTWEGNPLNTWVFVMVRAPSVLCWTCQVSRETYLCCSKPWEFGD